MVIAIDGPAGAGKSTVARGVANALGFTYLDSGAMYRSVALAVLRAGVDPDDGAQAAELARGLELELDGDRVIVGGKDVGAEIRSPEVSATASRVSVHPEVRAAMVERQRGLIAAGRYVAEGRDVAGDTERARRRAAQTGEPVAGVLAAIGERDARDRDRAHGALRIAEDAVELDTTEISAAEVVTRVVELARERGLA